MIDKDFNTPFRNMRTLYDIHVFKTQKDNLHIKTNQIRTTYLGL